MNDGINMQYKDLDKMQNGLMNVQNSYHEAAKEHGYDDTPKFLADVKKGKLKQYNPEEAIEPQYARDGMSIAQNGTSLSKKFENVKEKALKKAQALYPGKKVEVREMSGDRDIKTQAGLRASGASKTDVSIHNLGGAKDLGIFVDGKFIEDPSIYKKTTHAAAKEEGLHSLNWQKDPFHISAIQEGGKNTYANLIKQYPEVKNSREYGRTMAYLRNRAAEEDWTPTERRAYEQFTVKDYSLLI